MLQLTFKNSGPRTMVWEPGDEILVDEFTDCWGHYPMEIGISMGQYDQLTHQEIYQLEVLMYPNNDLLTVI